MIVGAEITTTEGHLLALDVTEVPEVGIDPIAAIEFVHDAGGLAVLAHPFDRFRQTYTTDLDRLAAKVDAVEILNSRCLLSRDNERASAFAAEHELAVTGGSDGHFPMEIGRAVTTVTDPLLTSIHEKTTTTEGGDGYLSGHLFTKLSDFSPL